MADELKLAMFDCDGTLVDSLAAIATVMAEAFIHHGYNAPLPDSLKQVIGLQLTVAIAGLLPEEAAEEHHALARTYQEISRTQRENGGRVEALYEGADAAVETLNREGWLLGVATGKSLRGLEHTLRQHDLLEHFFTLQTPDTAPGKPHPGMLLQAMAAAGVEPHNTVMIGDTTYDMEMAHNAGVRAVGVAWGYHTVESLLTAGADVVLDDFVTVPAALEQMIGMGR